MNGCYGETHVVEVLRKAQGLDTSVIIVVLFCCGGFYCWDFLFSVVGFIAKRVYSLPAHVSPPLSMTLWPAFASLNAN